MYEQNTNYLKQHIDILSFRDLAPGTIATYTSYMTQFIEWVEANLDAKPLPDITWVTTEVNSIIDAVYNPKHKAELALLYSSGIRVSVLTRLKCGDLFHSRHCIYISRSKNRSDRYAVLSEKLIICSWTTFASFIPMLQKMTGSFPDRKQVLISISSLFIILLRNGWL
jgi:integrase/recombinase XerD